MRNRYFSPDDAVTSSQFPLSGKNRLRWAGSAQKLPSYNPKPEYCYQKIGNYVYDISKEIGSGYSSKVYKAVNSKDNIEYAIKVVYLKKYSPSSLQMLYSYIQILRTLDHPNIIKCYDVFKTNSHCYIVTEYCCNGDLLGYLTRTGKLSQTATIEIISEIAEGLKYLLKNGILHRDLKPANILNNRKNWKIADFGFAIYSYAYIYTRHNVGTPLYMPPYALIKNTYSPQSDIFSLGIIFYELLTGITPWECKSYKELIKKMTTIPFHLSSKHQVSKDIVAIIESLCSIGVHHRLTKSEFLNLNIKKSAIMNPEKPESRKLENNREGTAKLKLYSPNKDHKKSKSKSNSKDSKKIVSSPRYITKESISLRHMSVKSGDSQTYAYNAQAEYVLKLTSLKNITNGSKDSIKEREQPKSRNAKLYVLRNSYIFHTFSPKLNKYSSAYDNHLSDMFVKKTYSTISYAQVCSMQLISSPKARYHILSSCEINTEESLHMQYVQPRPYRDIQEQKNETRNNHILINHLHYCRFIYYMARNINCFMLFPKSKIKLSLMLYKHLQKLIRNLSDKKTNWFNLKSWETFRKSKKYYTTQLTMKYYSIRYEKYYMNLLKTTDLNMIHNINKELAELSEEESFTRYFYRCMITNIGSLLRECNHNLALSIGNHYNEVTSNLRGNIEAIKSLFKYYKLLQVALEHFEDFETFEKNSNIKVQIDYRSASNTIRQFTDLRQSLKFI